MYMRMRLLLPTIRCEETRNGRFAGYRVYRLGAVWQPGGLRFCVAPGCAVSPIRAVVLCALWYCRCGFMTHDGRRQGRRGDVGQRGEGEVMYGETGAGRRDPRP